MNQTLAVNDSLELGPQTAPEAGNLETWVPVPTQRTYFPCDLGHLSFSFCNIGAVIHAGHVPGTVIPHTEHLSSGLAGDGLLQEEGKVSGKFKVYKKGVIHAHIKAPSSVRGKQSVTLSSCCLAEGQCSSGTPPPCPHLVPPCPAPI